MKFIAIVLTGCGLLWVLGASAQASRTVGLKLRVPRWLSRLFGSRTSYVDPGLLSLQILCLLAFLWSIPSALLSEDAPPGDMFRDGLLVIIVIVFVLFLFLAYLSKRQGSDSG
jgi:hypothetical protein